MLLKIGTALTLEPTSTEGHEKFHCKVVEQRDNVIFIDYPINTKTRKTVFLIDGTQFRVIFRTEDGVSYAFNTEVLGRRVGNIPMIMLSCPPEQEFIKIQRREFVRVNTAIDVAVEFNNQYYQLVTEDISAGGLALQLRVDPPFKESDTINLTIVLPFKNGDIHYVQTDAVVVRIFEKNAIRLASIQFTNTDDLDKQFIVRYCFERQLELRKKEMNLQ